MKELAMVRLVADEGKLLTDGTYTGTVIDVFPASDKDKWYEIDAPIEEEANGEPYEGE